MTKELAKTLTDQRQIAGYLRDALFNRGTFLIQFGERTFRGILENIIEKSARDRDGERALVFEMSRTGDSHNEWLVSGGRPEFSVALDRLMLRFHTGVLDVTASGLVVSMPLEASTVTSRKTHRFNAKHMSPRTCTVAVTDNAGKKFFGSFELGDISSDGLGGFLTIPGDRIPDEDLRIRGRLPQQGGAIDIDGNVSWISKDCSFPGRNRYNIGIKNWEPLPSMDAVAPTNAERRARDRLRADFPIEVVSPLYPQAPAILQLDDLSLSGLRARFLNLADSDLFRVGLEVTMIAPRLRLRVQRVTRTYVSFKVLKSATEEHIRLFNHHSFLSHRDLASGTAIGSDLTQVYTTSGSFSTSVAQRLSANREYLTQSTTRQVSQIPWSLRWLQQADDGRIRAAFLSAPYTDHIWYVGGLAGHMDTDLKMSGDFVSRFFCGMHAFFNSLGTPEYFLINWFKTNAWWNDWEVWLSKQIERVGFFRFEGDIAYLQDISEHAVNASSSCVHLAQGDIIASEAALSSIDSQPLRRLFGAFGLGTIGSGFASTAELLERAGHHFNRQFYLMRLEDCAILIMVSMFPSNIFLNGIINYPFVFSSRQLSQKELDQLVLQLLEISVSIGIDCPAFFLTVNGKAHEVRETGCLSLKEVIWTFGDTATLNYWSDS